MANAGQKMRSSNFNSASISGQAVSSGTDTTTSATYVSMTGTGSVTSTSFTVGAAVSTIKVSMFAGWSALTNTVLADFAVLINGTDYQLGHEILAAGVVGMFAGARFVTGIAAGTYTVQARWRRESGTGTAQRTTNDWLSMLVEAVS